MLRVLPYALIALNLVSASPTNITLWQPHYDPQQSHENPLQQAIEAFNLKNQGLYHIDYESSYVGWYKSLLKPSLPAVCFTKPQMCSSCVL